MISSFYEKIVGTTTSTSLLPQLQNNEQKILCVGLICLDIVQVCKQYPIEDSDQRCVEHRWQRGGNASNNCTVLSQAGANCEFLGTLSSESHLNFLKDDMNKYNIDYSNCPTIDGIGCPTSTVILSLGSGSRTILHHNPNLPELRLEDFVKLNLKEYSWIHFEGRNVNGVLSMMKHVEYYNKEIISNASSTPITVSVELEKSNELLIDLLPYVDVVFVGRVFAEYRGFDNMSETLRSISQEAKSGATVICAWGDRGAMARTPDGSTVQSPSFPPNKIIDSLGAGDTFTAAILFYLNRIKLSHQNKKNPLHSIDNLDDVKHLKHNVKHNDNIESLEECETEFINSEILQNALTFACKIAGTKIGIKGFDGLDKKFHHLINDNDQLDNNFSKFE